MPHKKVEVEPELFLEHNGVKVWRTYDDDDITRPDMHRFTADPDYTDCDFGPGGDEHFSVKHHYAGFENPYRAKLPKPTDSQEVWLAWHNGGEQEAIIETVKWGIDAGLLENPPHLSKKKE